MLFEIIDNIKDIDIIAKGKAIQELKRLEKIYGKGSWRKLKGITKIRLSNGIEIMAEIHWYEAHGIGKKEAKIKRFL